MRFLLAFLIAFSPLLGYAQTVGKTIEFNSVTGADYYTNYVISPSAKKNALNTVTSSATVTRDTTNKIDNVASYSVDTSATNGYVEFVLGTVYDPATSNNCEFKGVFKGDGTLYSAQIVDGSGNTLNQVALTNGSGWRHFSVTFPCAASGSRKVRITQTTAGTSPAINVGKLYYGQFTGLSQVSQAQFFGGMEQVGADGGTCIYDENTSTGLTDFKDLGTGTGCNAWTTSGNVTAVGTNDHRLTATNMPPGQYSIELTGNFRLALSGTCIFRLSDGTNTYQAQSLANAAISGISSHPVLSFSIPYTSSQSSITLKLQAADDQANGCALLNDISGYNVSWKIYYFPTQAQSAITPQIPSAPTQQRFTSGSGTYTTPVGVKYIRVRMVGGGGGGAGSGTASIGNGGAGGNTTFGTSLLTANGGSGGTSNSSVQASGGTSTISSPAYGTALTGVNGGVAVYVANNWYGGASGGGTPFGGGASGGFGGNTGMSASPNTGAGGAGASTAAIDRIPGNGGAAGGYIDAIIPSPSSSYSYSVGAAGTLGTAGTNGAAGGAGGSGYIEVTEYYGSENVPLLVGSVTSNSSSALKDENAVIVCSSSSSIVRPSTSGWISVGNISSNRCALTFTGFSDVPNCQVTPTNSQTSTIVTSAFDITSSTAGSIGGISQASGTTTALSTSTHLIRCIGPR